MDQFSDNSSNEQSDISEMDLLKSIIVKTGDLKDDYNIIGPVFPSV